MMQSFSKNVVLHGRALAQHTRIASFATKPARRPSWGGGRPPSKDSSKYVLPEVSKNSNQWVDRGSGSASGGPRASGSGESLQKRVQDRTDEHNLFANDFDEMHQKMIARRWEQCLRKRTGNRRFKSNLDFDNMFENPSQESSEAKAKPRKVGKL